MRQRFWLVCAAILGTLSAGCGTSDRFGSLVPASAPATLQRFVKSPPKDVQLSKDYLRVVGRWRNTGKSNYSSLSKINSVDITCSRPDGNCREVVAAIFARGLDGERVGFIDGELELITNDYHVAEWSEDRVIAVSETEKARWELRIYPRTGTADRVYTERKYTLEVTGYVLE